MSGWATEFMITDKVGTKSKSRKKITGSCWWEESNLTSWSRRCCDYVREVGWQKETQLHQCGFRVSAKRLFRLWWAKDVQSILSSAIKCGFFCNHLVRSTMWEMCVSSSEPVSIHLKMRKTHMLSEVFPACVKVQMKRQSISSVCDLILSQIG